MLHQLLNVNIGSKSVIRHKGCFIFRIQQYPQIVPPVKSLLGAKLQIALSRNIGGKALLEQWLYSCWMQLSQQHEACSLQMLEGMNDKHGKMWKWSWLILVH